MSPKNMVKTCDRVQRAFTLVELLVVISIIALLLSILLPSLQRARQQAKSVICLSNMKQLGIGELLYLQDNKDAFFRSNLSDQTWYIILDKGKYPYPSKHCTTSRTPKDTLTYPYEQINYAYNMGLGFGEMGTSGWRRPYGVNRANECKSPKKIILFCESFGWFYWNSLGGQGANCGIPWEPKKGLWGRLSITHNAAQNISFLDGHVEHRPMQALSFWDWAIE